MRDPMDDSLTEPSLPTCFVCHQPEDGHVHPRRSAQMTDSETRRRVGAYLQEARKNEQARSNSILPSIIAAIL